jgi:hypothetical protein
MNRFRVEQIEPYKYTVEDTEWSTILGTFGLRESAQAFAHLLNGREFEAGLYRDRAINRLDGKPAPVDATSQ